MVDMSSRNISQWLLKTRDQYYKKRYGGFEFGIKNPLADLDLNLVRDIFTRLDKATNLGQERFSFFQKTIAFNSLGWFRMFVTDGQILSVCR